MIKDTIFENPIPLLAIKDSRLKKQIDSYLPFSTGFEIECNRSSNYNVEEFEEIPNIIEVASTNGEERFRVPSGLQGLLCIWQICEKLKTNCELTESGIHIHIDFTQYYDYLTTKVLQENESWILEELDTWGYKGTYNKRGFSSNLHYTGKWVRFQNFYKTLEFRICEMTFEYPVLINRIIHCNDIVRRFAIGITEGAEKLELINLRKKLEDMKKSKEEEPEFIFTSITQEVIKSRIKRI